MPVRFLFKHACALAALSLGLILSAFAAYFVLLAIAIVFDLGLGGPLALPFMMVSGGIAAIAGTCVAFFPATAIAEHLRRHLHLPWICEIPMASALSMIAAFAIALHFSKCSCTFDFALTVFVWWLVLALPLGFYWWTMQASDVLMRTGLRAASILVRALSRALPCL